MPIKTSSAKAKGRNLQKHIRDRITEVFELEDGDVESRSMGAGGVDIMMSPKARRAFPVSVEAKSTRGTPSSAQVEQAKYNTIKGTIGAVVWKPHGKAMNKSLIMFEFEEFLQWWRDNHGNE